MGKIHRDSEELPFHEEEELPDALRAEIRSWRPRPGDFQTDYHGRNTLSDKGTKHFLLACKNLFKKNRHYIYRDQISAVGDELLTLWGFARGQKVDISGPKAAFTLDLGYCTDVKWCINLSDSSSTQATKITRSRRVAWYYKSNKRWKIVEWMPKEES